MNVDTMDTIKHFESLLQQETSQLQDLESQGLLSHDENWEIGLELEGWFLDKSLNPRPLAPKMIAELKQAELSEEIAEDVFEINLNPLVVKANFLECFDQNLTSILQKCNHWSTKNDTKIVTIGMLPHISAGHFTKELLTHHPRTQLLNKYLLEQRKHQPWLINIQGEDTLELVSHNICLEAATTSTQFHLKVPHHQMVDTYNRAQLLAAPMVAIGANAPFFNSHSLWHDTRIPLVQQTVSEQLPPACWTNKEDRVLFGESYIRQSIVEIFQNNLQFSSLIPLIDEQKTHAFHHLKTHNGSIWRWNRPVLGENINSGEWHIRLEHRVQSAGTSASDIAAQLGFFVGILAYWEMVKFQPTMMLPFNLTRDNFYQAAKYGLGTTIFWEGSKSVKLLDIIQNQLLPQAKKGLLSLRLSPDEISFYLDEILGERLKRGLSGAVWQKKQAKAFGSVHRMLESYHNNQQALKPLWRWDD